MKNKNFSKFLVVLAIVTIVVVPVFASALDFSKTLIPCGWVGARDNLDSSGNPTLLVPNEPNSNPPVPRTSLLPAEQCNFNDFIIVIGRIVNGTVILISVWAAISFMYAGYAYLTSGGNEQKVSYAKQIFTKVLIGYIIILTAWLFIYTIEQAFYTSDTNGRPNSFLNNGTPSNSQ